MAGLGKMVLLRTGPEKTTGGQAQRSRAEWLHGRLSNSHSEFRSLARADVQSIVASKLPRRQPAARIGLLTLSRLLADVEPFRLRWALQHWPYPIVKLTRSLMSAATKRSAGYACRRDRSLENRLGTTHAGGTAGRHRWPEPGAGEDESRST